MEFSKVNERALEIRSLYKGIQTSFYGKPWSYVESTQGMVGDVGDLMKLVMAKAKMREYKGDDIDGALAHELSDIMWSVLVVANQLNIDIEKEFLATMDGLEKRTVKGKE